MKTIKCIIILMVLAVILGTIPACSDEEPQVSETGQEPTKNGEQEVTEEPVTEEQSSSEKQEKEAFEELPQLIWSTTHTDDLNSIAVSPDGDIVAVGEYKVVFLHLAADGSLVGVITYEHTVEDLGFSNDGSIIGAGQGYYGVLLKDIVSDTELTSLGSGYNSRLAFSPDGSQIATGDRAGIVWLWHRDEWRQTVALEEPSITQKPVVNRFIVAMDYHPSGSLLASTHTDNTVYIWDLEGQQVVQTFEYHADVTRNNAFRFSPDGNIMGVSVIEGREHLVRLLTVDGAVHLADLPVPERVRDLSFSPDGNMLAVASRLATTIWDVHTGALLYTLDQTFDQLGGNSPRALAFTPDGGHLSVARWDGTLEMWRLPGAEPIIAPPMNIYEPPPLPSDVLFDTGSAELKQTADTELEIFAEALRAEFTKARITFIGHTDSRGASDYNLKLSMDRAAAVKTWFEDWARRNEVDGWVLNVDGRGDTELKVPDTNVEGTFLENAGMLNRRVEIDIEVMD